MKTKRTWRVIIALLFIGVWASIATGWHYTNSNIFDVEENETIAFDFKDRQELKAALDSMFGILMKDSTNTGVIAGRWHHFDGGDSSVLETREVFSLFEYDIRGRVIFIITKYNTRSLGETMVE